MLTILCRVNDSCKAEGSLSLTVERFDFDLKLCQWRYRRVFVDVAFGQRVSYSHFPPLVPIVRFKSDNITKVRSVVVLWLYGLLTKAQNQYTEYMKQTSEELSGSFCGTLC